MVGGGRVLTSYSNHRALPRASEAIPAQQTPYGLQGCLTSPEIFDVLFKKKHFFLIFLLHFETCEVLVPLQLTEPTILAVEAWSLNHWTTREVPPWGI